MRLCEITIRPLSALGTPLMGDTLFGQFCWQAAYDPHLLNGGLKYWLSRYEERPFAVFSSALMRFRLNSRVVYAVKRPELPLSWFFQPLADRRKCFVERKRIKRKPWLLVEENGLIDLGRLAGQEELWDLLLSAMASEKSALYRRLSKSEVQPLLLTMPQPHNTIRRLTQTTGKGAFAPYVMENLFYIPGAELALLVLVDEEALDLTRLTEGLRRIGHTGFGRDASIGLGRFEVVAQREMPLPRLEEANACYTLAPCVPAPGSFREAFFVPFVRYGKHGDRLAVSRHPFKAPVVMAAQGAVFLPHNTQTFAQPWFGRAVTGVSKIQPQAMIQGYSPYLPLKLEVRHD